MKMGRWRHYSSLMLVMFMGLFTSFVLSLDHHINHENLEGFSDRIHVEDSTSTPMTESQPWTINNVHPRFRFRDNKFSSMTSAVIHRPTVSHSNDWKVLTTTSYTIQVGNLVDGPANSNSCDPNSKLSTCNVRSAWALCLSLISQWSCGDSNVVSCAVVLPSDTTSVVSSGTYGAMDLSALTSWAAACTLTQVSLSVVGSVIGGPVASIQGDGTSSAFIDAENVAFLTLTMADLSVVGFGDGTMNFLSAVVVNVLQAAVFQRVSFSGNVGYSTGSAVYATSMGPMVFTNCVFMNNQQVLTPPFNTINTFNTI